MKFSRIIAFSATLLLGLMSRADGLTINCQDTLSNSNIMLELNEPNSINETSVKLIANGGEFSVDAVKVSDSAAGVEQITVVSKSGRVKFEYRFKNLAMLECLGTNTPDKAKPTHVEVVAWDSVVSWIQCGCVHTISTH